MTTLRNINCYTCIMKYISSNNDVFFNNTLVLKSDNLKMILFIIK